MIKSKRHNLIMSNSKTKARHKLDSNQDYNYSGFTKNTGVKYHSSNAYVTKTTYNVTKGYKQGMELNDV